MPKVKVSSKYQIVIPKEIRKVIKIEKGDELHIYNVNSGIYISKSPRNWTDYIWGLGKELWKGIDPAKYIESERKSWKRREVLLEKIRNKHAKKRPR